MYIIIGLASGCQLEPLPSRFIGRFGENEEVIILIDSIGMCMSIDIIALSFFTFIDFFVVSFCMFIPGISCCAKTVRSLNEREIISSKILQQSFLKKLRMNLKIAF